MSPRPPALRLLLLYDCLYPDSVGGVEHRNLELARALAARGHRVTLAGFGGDGTSPQPGVERQLLGAPLALHDAQGRRRAGEAAVYAAAAARHDLAGFDLVETASLPFAHLPALALRCRAAGVPLLVSWYEFWGRYWRDYGHQGTWPLLALWERWCGRLGRAAIASSQLTAGRLARHRSGGVAVVPVGIHAAAVAETAAAVAAGPPLLYAGRLIPEKRLDLLLAAVALLGARFAGPLLEVIGEGPDRSRLEALSGALGIADRVRFAGRVPAAADVWRALGAAQVAVQTSAREGFGIFPLEAMAAGRPVVFCTSPESAVGELVEAEREGLATPPEPEALAAALERLLADPAERRRLGANAQAKARRYDWSAIVLAFERQCITLCRR